VVINPADYHQTKAATLAIAEYEGPVYLRFGRPKWPVFTQPDQKFEIGKAVKFTDGADLSLFATGHCLWESLKAAEEMAKEGVNVEVINIHTIKPLDEQSILDSVAKTKRAVSAEEHQINGGLGESIASVLSRHFPAPLEIVGVNDSFGESGKPEELLQKYGLGADSIVEAIRRALKR